MIRYTVAYINKQAPLKKMQCRNANNTVIKLQIILILMAVIYLSNCTQSAISQNWWDRYTDFGNYTQMMVPQMDVPVIPNNCTQRFGWFCIDCTEFVCLKCQSKNFTLNQSTLQLQTNSPNSMQACTCRSPYLYNLLSDDSTIATEKQLINQISPCILCTDKYSLNSCLPAAYSIGQSIITTNITSNGTTTSFTTAKMMIAYNRPRLFFANFVNLQMIKRAYSIHFQIDGSLIDIPPSSLKFQDNPTHPNYSIFVYIQRLDQIMYHFYTQNNYTILNVYRIQIRKRTKGEMLVNGSGQPVPQSYQTQVGFKGVPVNSYSFDNTYSRYLNGTQALRFVFPTPVKYLAEQSLKFNKTIEYIQNVKNVTNNSQNTYQNQSNLNSSYQIYKQSNVSSQHQEAQIELSNNYRVYYIFDQTQQTIKQSIQIGFVGLATLGLMGTGASNWLTLILSLTQIFKGLGFYQYQQSTGASSKSQYSDSTDNRLLLGQQNHMSQTSQQQQRARVLMLKQISENTIMFNPLILHQAQQNRRSKTLSSFTIALTLTNAVVLVSMIVLVLFLLYLNGYTRSKTNYDLSHLFSILGERYMVRRVVYIILKGMYPIIFYSLAIFVKQLYHYFSQHDANRENQSFKQLMQYTGNSSNNKMNWHMLYLIQNLLFGILALGVPIFGILYFDRNDKNNIYVYSRMYGEEQAQDKQSTPSNGSSQSSSQDSQPHIDLQNQSQDNHVPTKKDKGKQSQCRNAHNQPQQSNSKHTNTSRITQTTEYIKEAFLKQFSKQTTKTAIYFIYEFVYTSSCISISVFVSQLNTIRILLTILTSIFAIYTLYCTFTVSVSKMHSIIKIIDLGLILTFIILMFLWDSSVAAANLAYYLLYGSAIWMGICVSYSILSMVYWEIKGIGVYAYFSHKIVPITSNVDLQSISGVPKKTQQVFQSQTTIGITQLTQLNLQSSKNIMMTKAQSRKDTIKIQQIKQGHEQLPQLGKSIKQIEKQNMRNRIIKRNQNRSRRLRKQTTQNLDNKTEHNSNR